jgi:hypothetical protein
VEAVVAARGERWLLLAAAEAGVEGEEEVATALLDLHIRLLGLGANMGDDDLLISPLARFAPPYLLQFSCAFFGNKKTEIVVGLCETISHLNSSNKSIIGDGWRMDDISGAILSE